MNTHPLYGTYQSGVLIKPSNRFHVIELYPLPSVAISAALGHPHHVDYVTLTAQVDAWTAEIDDEEAWERRWVDGPPMTPNVLATQYANLAGRHAPLYGPVVLASKRTNLWTERIVTVGLTDEDLNEVVSVLAFHHRLLTGEPK